MAKYCVDTNVFIDALRAIKRENPDSNISGKDIYKKIRQYVKAPGELVITQGVVDEVDRIMNSHSPKYKKGLRDLSIYYSKLKELFRSNQVRVFSLSPEEQAKVRDKKEELTFFKPKNSDTPKNIYTDYRIAKECSVNKISNIISRNEKDFEEIKEYDPSIKVKVIKADDSLYATPTKKNEALRFFSNSLAGRIIRMINEIWSKDRVFKKE